VWFVTGIPTVWMYVVSVWALGSLVARAFERGFTADPVPWVGVALLVLAVLMLIEATRILRRPLALEEVRAAA
jgi:carbon starvation protein